MIAPLHLLVVDDDDDFLFLISRALIRRGHVVICCSTAVGLVEYAAGCAVRPHAIVLDRDLPDLSGVDAVRLLSDDPRTSSIPVLLCSAAAGGPEPAHHHCQTWLKNGHSAETTAAIEATAALTAHTTIAVVVTVGGPSLRATPHSVDSPFSLHARALAAVAFDVDGVRRRSTPPDAWVSDELLGRR